MKGYKTILKDGRGEHIEKKSRFLSFAYPIKTSKEALEHIKCANKTFYDSTHVVYAYKIKDENVQCFSDDGEPRATAGIPVLDVINKNDITDVLVIVVRYFGGTLLGTGGLVRAYCKGASLSISDAKIINMTPCTEFQINCEYNMLGKIQYVLENNVAIKTDIIYENNVKLFYYIKDESLEKLKKEVTDATFGNVTVHELNKVLKFTDEICINCEKY